MMALGGKTLLQRLRTAAGMGPPITTFAALPSAGSVPGQLRQLSDVNNIIVQSLGGIWRPYGGSQVLAQRGNNPVTIQNLTGQVAEAIGPFPGGLVRAGMQLRFDGHASMAGIGPGNRLFRFRVGPSLPLSDAGRFINAYYSVSQAVNGDVLLAGILNILSDVSAAHRGGPANFDAYAGSGHYYSPVVDFSAPWYADIVCLSCAETAVNITGATWAAGVATFTCTAHTLVTGDKTVIAGISPSGWNVAAGAIATRIDNNTFSIPLAADPGAYVSGGTSSRISNMISQSYVLTLKG